MAARSHRDSCRHLRRLGELRAGKRRQHAFLDIVRWTYLESHRDGLDQRMSAHVRADARIERGVVVDALGIDAAQVELGLDLGECDLEIPRRNHRAE